MNTQNTAKLTRLSQWYTGHKRSFLSSLSELLRKPLASLMTLMVIGIALALPSGLYIVLQNLQNISQDWDKQGSISLYLKKGTPDFEISALLKSIKNNNAVESAQYISPEKGLSQFQKVAKFGDILSELKQNPLPGVIVVTPKENYQSPARLNKLLATLKNSDFIDTSQIDMAWIKRLYFIITISKRITYSLALLFGLGVLLIIGNTIRLTIEHHHEEMMVMKLVGATDAFIRRPLLYRGLLYGLLGGLLAWILVGLTLWWLASPAQALASSYNQSLLFEGLSIASGALILAISTLLGVIGAWLAAHRQLRLLN